MRTGGCQIRGACGFTLVELMIVCAITMVLIGVGFPCYRQYKRQARQTACVGLLREMLSAKESFYLTHVEGASFDANQVCGAGKIIEDQNTLKCPEANNKLQWGGITEDPYCNSYRNNTDFPHNLTSCYTF